MKGARTALLICAGVGIGWIASSLVDDRVEYDNAVVAPEDSPDSATANFGSESDALPDAATRSSLAGDPVSTAEPSTAEVEYSSSERFEFPSPAPDDGLVADDFEALPSPTLAIQQENTHVGVQLSDLPASAAASAVNMAETLLSDTQIVCKLQGWRGGPLVIDLVDYYGPGTARMSGALSAPEMEFVVRMEVTADGLHFSGLTSNGNFLALTVFAVTDETGRYAAVHSRHVSSITVNSRTSGYFGTEWYGGCL